MKKLTISFIIVIGIVIIGTISFLAVPKSISSPTNSPPIIWLSAVVEAGPADIMMYLPQQRADLDNGITTLDNTTLSQNPELKNALDQAFNGYVPISSMGSYHPTSSIKYTSKINQNDANSILQLALSKVQTSEMQTKDPDLGISFVTQTSKMKFKFDGYYYTISIEKAVFP